MGTKSKLSLGLVMLVLTSLAHAGLREGDWVFAKGETDIKAFSNTGAEYECKSFSPKAVSFIIKYNYPVASRSPIFVEADKASKVRHDLKKHTITITNAFSLDIRLPGKGKYEITNTTWTSVEGHKCSTGVY